MAEKPLCNIEGCDKPSRVRGWCETHYCRWKRHGDPLHTFRRRRGSSDPLPNTRKCTKCGTVKTLENFAKSAKSGLGVREKCKVCHRAEYRAYRIANAEKVRERARQYNIANREKVKAKGDRWRKANPERFRRNTEEWRKRNPEKVRAIVARRTAKERSNPKVRLEKAIKAGIQSSIRNGTKAGRRTTDLLGYTYEELKSHLERQFTKGMSWDNYGGYYGWHVDHIIPLVSFDYQTPDDPSFKDCWALTNLRPLWGRENRAKKDKRLHLL